MHLYVECIYRGVDIRLYGETLYGYYAHTNNTLIFTADIYLLCQC